MPGPTEAKRVIDQVLALSKAEQTEVVVLAIDSAVTRFANNGIHQNVAQRDMTVSVRAGMGRRYGFASTNDVSAAGLESAAERALAMARNLPERDDFLPFAGWHRVPSVNGYHLSTAEYGPMQRAAGVRTVCERARERGLTAAGAFRTDIGGLTIGNSQGLFAHHDSTTADLVTVVMSDDSSGHAGRLSASVEEIDPEAVAAEAVAKADRGRRPRAIGPGEYDVVLEEHAVSDLLDYLAFTGFGALAVQEGRSFMSGRLGQRVMGPNVSIWDDPMDPRTLVRPFDMEGMPAQRVELIAEGVARSPVYDRRTAAKEEKVTTGHALPPQFTFGPMSRNLFLRPGDATKQQMIASIQRGLLVTRFWYTRVVHPLTVQMTGMTRDGTFLIENGEIVAPVKNLRFTESYVGALDRVSMIARETQLVREFFSANRVPALKIAGWHFTGATEY